MDYSKDNKIMDVLKVSELRHIMAHTNKGELSLMLRKGEKEYRFVLDAVPVDDETDKKLKELYGKGDL